MKIYIMNGQSESCDDYPYLGVWKHYPSEAEQFEALWGTDQMELFEDEDDVGVAPFPNGEYIYIKDGVRYINFVHTWIDEIEVPE